jgi:multidrug efflux system membrane fusion protein
MTSDLPPKPDHASTTEPLLLPPPARRKRWPWIVAICVLLIAAVIVWRLRPATPADTQTPAGRGGAAQAGRPLPVVAAQAKTGSIDVVLTALGTVTPLNTVTVHSRVDGQLDRVLFTEGEIVKAGQLLAQIDPRAFEVALTQAVGQLARDQALLTNAHLDLQRYQTLLGQDSISKQQVDTQEALVRQYEGTVKSDQGAVDNAKLQLSYTRITAPNAGLVGLRQVDPGNIVHAADSNGLVVITQMQPITVIFPIPEDNLPRVIKRVKSGEGVPIDAYDRSQQVKLASGKLLSMDNQIDTTTGTVKLRGEFANADSALYPNQFVNVRMIVDTRPDAILVPSAAIQRGSPGTFVYVVKDDKTVSVQAVKLGPVQGEITAIDRGLAAGAMVVVDGADKLREGAAVELITAESRNVAPATTPRRGARGDKGNSASGDGSKRGSKGG